MAQKASSRPPEFWQRRGIVACLLWPLSLLFGLIASMRRRRLSQNAYQAPVPVIIVGNLIVGGAGKTPTLIALVEHLKQKGRTVGVISRGYGRTDENHCQEVLSYTPAEWAGDEPLLIHRKTNVPVFVAASRPLALKALLKQYPATNMIVADDGLQHYALARDIEVIVFDERGAGNGFLLPAGPLREPLSRVNTENLVLFNAPSPSVALPGFMALRRFSGWLPLDQWSECQGKVTHWLDMAELISKQPEQKIAAVAGIGQPQRFFKMLEACGAVLSQTQALADHDDFSDAASVFSAFNEDVILVTEKDAAKCAQKFPTNLRKKIGVVGLDYQPEQAFFDKLDKMLF